MAIILKCPDCEQKFKWTFSDESRWPDHCPLCGEFMGIDKDDTVIVMPSLRSARTDANDKVYRDMERGSEQRVHLAAEAAGCSPAEMSSLKITNLNDRRDSEIAAMPVQNTVTQHMDSMNARGGQFGFSGMGGAEWAVGTKDGAVTVNGRTVTGIAPRAGVTAIGAVQRLNGSR